ncbi:MAG: biotin-dependent carboxyltransferase family protein [Thaumarchaeota archaeon]|nr:biotin-dependent carboxyltransferase family protein [Nitrososphaerota archaeon]
MTIQGTQAPSLEVLKGGVEATVQDYPGRLGYWDIGIPPSGPLDDYSFRLANRLVGNRPGDAALEVAAGLFSMRAKTDLVVAVTGAEMQSTMGGKQVPMWESFLVKQGEDLTLGIAKTSGFRAYVAVAGGIQVPDYLGSKSTFAAGGFGGFQGRALKAGDELEIGKSEQEKAGLIGRKVVENAVPRFNQTLEVEATVGPQAAPEFIKEEDLAAFFSEVHKIDRNANRLGYRLTPRQWKWARSDGGVAGKHPSNIIDNGYTVGSVNVSGDQPIILMRDGPSAGGFVCLCCVVTGSLWKVGQAAPGRDQVKFKKVSYDEAIELRRKLEKNLETGVK